MENINNQKFRCAVLDKNEIVHNKGCYFFLKRLIDIIFSLLALVLLSPILLIISIIVFIDSPKASPIFIQERVGVNGKVFKLYKFRSMVPDAEAKLDKLLALNEMEGNAFKIKNDPRITKVGKFLRMTSLDELPELFNILKGDMSIIGPRPLLVKYLPLYNEYQKKRHNVRPGLSGLAQISGRNAISWEEKFDWDVKYIENITFCGDIKIIILTLWKAFVKEEGISAEGCATTNEFLGLSNKEEAKKC